MGIVRSQRLNTKAVYAMQATANKRIVYRQILAQYSSFVKAVRIGPLIQHDLYNAGRGQVRQK